jgi:hypothetical protein
MEAWDSRQRLTLRISSKKASLTLMLSLDEVSMKPQPRSRANWVASATVTWRLRSRSFLVPTSKMGVCMDITYVTQPWTTPAIRTYVRKTNFPDCVNEGACYLEGFGTGCAVCNNVSVCVVNDAVAQAGVLLLLMKVSRRTKGRRG